MLRLTVALTVDGYPLNLTILSLSKGQPRKLANKIRTVTKISFKIENTLYIYPSQVLFEVWHQIIMTLEQ